MPKVQRNTLPEQQEVQDEAQTLIWPQYWGTYDSSRLSGLLNHFMNQCRKTTLHYFIDSGAVVDYLKRKGVTVKVGDTECLVVPTIFLDNIAKGDVR